LVTTWKDSYYLNLVFLGHSSRMHYKQRYYSRIQKMIRISRRKSLTNIEHVFQDRRIFRLKNQFDFRFTSTFSIGKTPQALFKKYFTDDKVSAVSTTLKESIIQFQAEIENKNVTTSPLCFTLLI